MNKIIDMFKDAVVGVGCCIFVITALCLEFQPAFISDTLFFVKAQQLFDFLKTDYSLVNTGFLVLMSIYGVVRIALSVVTFKRYVLNKQLQQS